MCTRVNLYFEEG